jgi:hypothetical protein
MFSWGVWCVYLVRVVMVTRAAAVVVGASRSQVLAQFRGPIAMAMIVGLSARGIDESLNLLHIRPEIRLLTLATAMVVICWGWIVRFGRDVITSEGRAVLSRMTGRLPAQVMRAVPASLHPTIAEPVSS